MASSWGGLNEGNVSTANAPLGTTLAISRPVSRPMGEKSRRAAPKTAARTTVNVGWVVATGAGVGDTSEGGAVKTALFEAIVISLRSFWRALTVKSL